MTSKINKLYFKELNTDNDDFVQITISSDAYKIENLIIETYKIVIEEVHSREGDYPFTTKPNFPTLGSIIKPSSQKPLD